MENTCASTYACFDHVPDVFEGIDRGRETESYFGILQNHVNANTLWFCIAVKLGETTSNWDNRQDLSIFAGASICYISLVVKITYVLQILHCPSLNVQR